MTTTDRAPDAAKDAAQRFAHELRDRTPDMIRVQMHGADGIACLCAVEAVIAALWPSSPAKELVWLTRTSAPDSLLLQAFAGGELLRAATYDLSPAGAG